jgi:hypothetical protein
MPRRNSLISRLRHGRAWDEWDEGWGGDDAAKAPAPSPATPEPSSRRRRMVVTFAFATLFVAGAAFSAGAGNQVRSMLESQAAGSASGEDVAATTDESATTTTEPAPPADPAGDTSAPADEPAPAEAPSDEAAAPAAPAAPSQPTAAPPASQSAPAVAAATAAVQQAAVRSGSIAHARQRVRARHASPRRPYVPTMRAQSHAHLFPKPRRAARPATPDLDGAAPGGATVWLNRAMPDPTPLALRLEPRFAKHLLGVSRRHHVGWPLMLGVLRADGHRGSAPANLAGLKSLADRLAGMRLRAGAPWAAMFSLSGDTAFADRAVALSHYYRAVGLRALVRGLEAQKESLGKKVLNDPRVSIYAGGRGDIQSGRVNVRVLATIEYLAESFGQVSVSCLISGHRLYARPGVISAHIYGLAADISALDGVAITGHQQPGSVTERAVRDLLLLPPEMLPKQVISLIGLGGPSFPLANHYDHIHIGY